MASEWPHHPNFTLSEFGIILGFLASGGVFGCFTGLELADQIAGEEVGLTHGLGAFVGTAFGLFIGTGAGVLLVRLSR